MATEYGFVYVLGNESMPGLYKIGHTKFHPAIRARELSAATGCPTAFCVLAYFASEDAYGDERQMHSDLDQYRVNDRREFFSAPADRILSLFMRHSGYPHDATFLLPLNNLVVLEEFEATEK